MGMKERGKGNVCHHTQIVSNIFDPFIYLYKSKPNFLYFRIAEDKKRTSYKELGKSLIIIIFL